MAWRRRTAWWSSHELAHGTLRLRHRHAVARHDDHALAVGHEDGRIFRADLAPLLLDFGTSGDGVPAGAEFSDGCRCRAFSSRPQPVAPMKPFMFVTEEVELDPDLAALFEQGWTRGLSGGHSSRIPRRFRRWSHVRAPAAADQRDGRGGHRRGARASASRSSTASFEVARRLHLEPWPPQPTCRSPSTRWKAIDRERTRPPEPFRPWGDPPMAP